MSQIMNRNDIDALHDTNNMDQATAKRFWVCDQITMWLQARPGEWFAPSVIARGAHCTTHEARVALAYLVAHQYVTASGNGAWTRYALGR